FQSLAVPGPRFRDDSSGEISMRKPSHRRGISRSGCESRQPEKAPGRKQTACPLAVEQLEIRCLPSTLLPISLPSPNQPPSDTATGASIGPSVSGDGRYVVFQSNALNLIPGQTGGAGNVFLFDRVTSMMTLVNHIPGSTTAAPASGYTRGN